MKTTLEIVDIIYKYLDESSLKPTITGQIYKNDRPVNSRLEDVVINSLPINNEQLQEGVINVNIFVSNQVHKINDVQDDTQANHPRLKQLSALACGILKDVFLVISDCGFDIQQQNMLPDETAKEHFINIRLKYYGVN